MDEIVKVQEEYLIPEIKEFLVKYDGELYVNHFLIDLPFPVYPTIKHSNNGYVNSSYNQKKKIYDESLIKKDYDDVLMIIEDKFRIIWFIDHYKEVYKDVGDRKYYQLLEDILTKVDHHYHTKEFYNEIIRYGNDPTQMMNSKERKKLGSLPERFDIYRGVSYYHPITKKNFEEFIGNSWTLNRERSVWFTERYESREHKEHHSILTYTVSKDEIICYFTRRNEEEIFVDYTKLDYSKIKIEKL